jgi:5-methylcytosine-specific restriction endonuclease McrA
MDWHKPPRFDPPRESSSKRGYGRAWQRLRGLVLAGEPLCRRCLERGITRAATDVDHVDGNVRNLKRKNLMPLCHSCHSRKTVAKDGGLRGKRL